MIILEISTDLEIKGGNIQYVSVCFTGIFGWVEFFKKWCFLPSKLLLAIWIC